MTSVAVAAVVALSLSAQRMIPQGLERAAVREIKRTLVSRLDPALPDVPLEKWMRTALPKDWKTSWRVGDCDEKWDFPEPAEGYRVCVSAFSYAARGSLDTAKLLILAGTTRRGLLPTPSFYQLLVTRSQTDGGLLKLPELTAWTRRK